MICNLKEKTVLITGSSRGIGKAIATQFKGCGAEVIIHGSNPKTVEKTATELGVEYIIADLSDSNSVTQLAEKAGKIDILVNNAGITHDGLFLRQSDEQWEQVLQVNLNSAVKLTKLLLPNMLKNRWGRVINISSVVAHMGNKGQTNYVASKAAMTGFTKALAIEIARKNITVNCIAPGFIETTMTQKMDEKARDTMLAKIPAGRFGNDKEIAAAAMFLASEEAAYITGTTLHVNGGMYNC